MKVNLGVIEMVFIPIENNRHCSSYGFLRGLPTLHLSGPEFLLLLGDKFSWLDILSTSSMTIYKELCNC